MPSAIRSTLVAAASLCLLGIAVAWQSPADKDAPGRLPVLTPADGPRWYKGNLHTHSLWSDGDDFPEMIADWYKRHGYHFLGLSDHNVLNEGVKWVPTAAKGPRAEAVRKYVARFGPEWVQKRERLKEAKKGEKVEKPEKVEEVRLKPLDEYRAMLEEPGKFLLVPAEEITHQFAKAPVHVNAVNVRDAVKPANGPTAAETISVQHRLVAEQAKKTGRRMFAFLNHPNFQWALTAEDLVASTDLKAFEIHNGHSGVRNEGDALHPSTERMWDIVLALRLGKNGLGPVMGMATDDSHAYHSWGLGKTNPGRGWVMVRAEYLTAEALVKALEAGAFYCSTGVTLSDVVNTQEKIALTIAAEKGVTYRTEFIATMKDADLSSIAAVDKDGKEVPRVSRVYGKDVGKVVASSDSLTPSYVPTGNELYVRARVVSSKPHPNPYRKGETETAWTQPVTPGKK